MSWRDDMSRLDRTPCRRCGHAGALHATRCFSATTDGRCGCSRFKTEGSMSERLTRICIATMGVVLLLALGFKFAVELAR